MKCMKISTALIGTLMCDLFRHDTERIDYIYHPKKLDFTLLCLILLPLGAVRLQEVFFIIGFFIIDGFLLLGFFIIGGGSFFQNFGFFIIEHGGPGSLFS